MGQKAKRAKTPGSKAAIDIHSSTFERVRPVNRAWLLATSGLVAGLLATAGGVSVARADDPATCLDQSHPGFADYWYCWGDANAISGGDAEIDLSAGGTFAAQFVNFDPEGPFQWNGSHTYGVLIDANGHVTDGPGIEFQSNTFIHNSSGIGLGILDPANVQLFLDGADNNGPAAEIFGSHGIYVDSTNVDGNIHIFNNGFAGGGDGSGIYATGGTEDGSLRFELDNHSYDGTLGDGGVAVGTDTGVTVQNQIIYARIHNAQGLILGEFGEGVHINQVFNGDGGDAVHIDNNDDGLIVGFGGNGVNIQEVGGLNFGDGHVQINNGGYRDDSGTLHDGGIIVGSEDGVGVYVHNTEDGGVDVYNSGTLAENFTVPNNEEGFGFLAGETFSRGIYGESGGVDIGSIGGHVGIQNGAYVDDNSGMPVGGGLIVGYDGNGVSIKNVFAWDNGNGGFDQGAYVNNQQGLIWGGGRGSDGVHTYNVDGQVHVNNQGGAIFGVDEGVHIAQTNATEDSENGHVAIENAGGRIEGFYGDGVHVWNANQVDLNNGYLDAYFEDNTVAPTDGGRIYSADSAIYIHDVNTVGIRNALDGAIIGDGNSQPVIDLNTYNGTRAPGDQATHILNFGIMADRDIPGFVQGGWSAPNYDPLLLDADLNPANPLMNLPVDHFDAAAYQSVMADVSAIGNFVGSGGQQGSIDALNSYSDAASGWLLKGRGGAVNVENHTLMIGELDLWGHNTTNEDGRTGNEIQNIGGTWFTVGDNNIHGSSNDSVNNGGLIQVAFNADNEDGGLETTHFFGVNEFSNGGYFDHGTWVDHTGLLSMIDGAPGDAVFVDHWFNGSGYNDGSTGQHSFIGLDVNFGPGAGPEGEPNAYENYGWDQSQDTWRSDRFWFGSEDGDGGIDGSTGLVIHKSGTGTNMVHDTIVVGYAVSDDNSSDQQCFNVACKAGDTVYIASASQGYFDFNGVGEIQDGLYAWHLEESQDGPNLGDPIFQLVSDWAPQTVQLPGLTTGAQNIWNDIAGQVEDHVYGEHFPAAGEGGGGADLPAVEPEATKAASNGVSIWGKVTGNRFQRSTSVTQTPPGITIDTSLVQNTFALLGGADYSTNGTGDGIRAGAFGGYTNSGLAFTSYGASATYTGGVIGGYLAYTQGGFYADGEAQGTLQAISYTGPGLSATATATSLGILANAGYRIQSGDAYVEPIGSLSYVATSVSSLAMGGGTVTFSNGQSERIGAGVRIGTAVGQIDGMTGDVNLVAKIWDEFGPANTVTVSDGVNTTSFSDGISGVFGELRATGTLTDQANGFSVFGSAGIKTNGSFTSLDGKAGVRKTF